MEKRTRILFKLVLTVVLSILFVWLVYTDKNVFQKKLTQPAGELAETEDVFILAQELCHALADSGSDLISEKDFEDFRRQCFSNIPSQKEEESFQYLSYETYIKLLDLLTGNWGESDSSNENSHSESPQDKVERLIEKITYEDKYEEGFFLLKNDWNNSYSQLLKFYGLEEDIKINDVTILCGNQNLVGTETIGEDYLLDLNGKVYSYVSSDFADLIFATVKAYVRENRLLTLISPVSDENMLSNVWIMEADKESIQFFYDGYEIVADYATDLSEPSEIREQIGDISFKNGGLSNISLKRERIGGKLLGISETQLEVEGYGNIPIGEHCVGYQLYEELCIAGASEMAIGYDFTDFVLEKGKVCAFLITRKESMETIRVAIKNSSDNSGSLYHDELAFSSQDDLTISYGSYNDRKQETLAAGEELTIKAGGKYLSGERIVLSPITASGKIQVRSNRRSQGIPEYRGKMEILETNEGLVLINEVLLEEYLYSVVASEMPAHYPLEALKAQAVCARTYGYRYLKSPGYEAIGAHVDDSVSYQVYNNMAENVNSTKAVKETAGVLLLYEEEPVNTYYYSTSCGFGADAGVWSSDKKDEFPYLTSVHIAQAQNTLQTMGVEADMNDNSALAGNSAKALSQEENFRDYITQVDEDAYEKDETWFRWHYQVDELDVSLLSQKLRERYQAGASKVLTFTGEGNPAEQDAVYEARTPEKFKEIYDIWCLKRKEGGVMDELLIETDEGIYKIITEYNIRYILNQGGEAVGQNDATLGGSLLPSAYIIIDTVKSGENVIGYKIIGGGYGHGVGMTQNGAKAMGLEGMDYESILSFYYQGCQLGKIY